MPPSTFCKRNRRTVMLTQERLRDLLEYNPESGVFTWKVKRRGPNIVGGRAGCENGPRGYCSIKVGGVIYLQHRLVWFYMTGEWPQFDIDHRNGYRKDNRFSNLRSTTRKQNLENQKLHRDNTSGFRGVTFDKRTSRFVARVTHRGRGYHVGIFDSPEQAAVAAKTKRDELFTHHHTSHSA